VKRERIGRRGKRNKRAEALKTYPRPRTWASGAQQEAASSAIRNWRTYPSRRRRRRKWARGSMSRPSESADKKRRDGDEGKVERARRVHAHEKGG
jgi:hypothetical protein